MAGNVLRESSLWVYVGVSASILVLVILFFLNCVGDCGCWKKNKRCFKQMYIIDESGISKHSEYRTDSKVAYIEDIFTSENLPIMEKYSENDLNDSMGPEKFQKSVLKIESDLKDETESCQSTDSKYTFFSVRPVMSRSTSRAESYYSFEYDSPSI